jgi:hypothetical protein
MEVTGQLKVKGEVQQVSDKFKKRDFVVTVDPTSQYPQHISIQLTQDKCNLIDSFNLGDELKVHINLRGREWKSPQGEIKYFNTIEAWRIEGQTKGASAPVAQNAEPANETTFGSAAMQEDDLPF